MRFILALFLMISADAALGLDIENRVLVPNSGRSPAEAGLESGRYQEIDQKDLAGWEKKRDLEIDQDFQRAPSKTEGQDFPLSRTGSKIEE